MILSTGTVENKKTPYSRHRRSNLKHSCTTKTLRDKQKLDFVLKSDLAQNSFHTQNDDIFINSLLQYDALWHMVIK